MKSERPEQPSTLQTDDLHDMIYNVAGRLEDVQHQAKQNKTGYLAKVLKKAS